MTQAAATTSRGRRGGGMFGTDFMSVRKAASECGVSRSLLEGLIEDEKLAAYQTGGTDDAPWLVVNINEAKAAVLAHRRYRPAGAKAKAANPDAQQEHRTRRASRIGTPHPKALDMLRLGARRG